MDAVTVVGPHVTLRPPAREHVDAVTAACQDLELQRRIPVPVPYRPEHARAWVDGAAEQWAADGELRWVVTDSRDGSFLGAMSLHAREPGMRELGYWTAPHARGHGSTAEAARQACRWGFDVLGLRRIECLVAVGNLASWRVAEAAGFVREGVARDRVETRGVRADAWVGALLPGDLGSDGRPTRPRRGIEPAEISTGGLHLRPPREDEAAAALRMLRDADTVRWNPAPEVTDLAAAAAWCRRGADWTEGTHATFSVVDATTEEYLGNVSLWGLDRDNRTASIGYRVAPHARGRGVAKAAAAAVTRWGFGALGLDRITLPHSVGNAASCRIADRCGYRLEGVLRAACLLPDGDRADDHVHGRLAGDPEP